MLNFLFFFFVVNTMEKNGNRSFYTKVPFPTKLYAELEDAKMMAVHAISALLPYKNLQLTSCGRKRSWDDYSNNAATGWTLSSSAAGSSKEESSSVSKSKNTCFMVRGHRCGIFYI